MLWVAVPATIAGIAIDSGGRRLRAWVAPGCSGPWSPPQVAHHVGWTVANSSACRNSIASPRSGPEGRMLNAPPAPDGADCEGVEAGGTADSCPRGRALAGVRVRLLYAMWAPAQSAASEPRQGWRQGRGL